MSVMNGYAGGDENALTVQIRGPQPILSGMPRTEMEPEIVSIMLTDDEKDWLRKRGHGTGTHYFNMCALCGHPEWSCSNSNLPDDVIASIDGQVCRKCQEVHNRAPEIFDWVLSVLQWKDRMKDSHKATT